MIILLASGPWYINAAGWRVYFGPTLWSILMLAVAILLIKKAARLDLVRIHEKNETRLALAVRIIGYFLIILILRQLMIWQFYNPWEKLPMVFLVITQVVLVEQTKLDDIGLHGWNRQNIVLAVILGCVELLFVNIASIATSLMIFGNDVVDYVYVCSSCQLYWISFPYQFLAVGFAEELFFRGYIYTKLRLFFSRTRSDRGSFIRAMILTNVLFGLFHVPWYVGNWFAGDFSFDILGCIQRIIVTGTMGIFLSFLYEKTGSLSAPMLVHGFSNSIEPLIAFITPLAFPSAISAVLFDWRYVISSLVTLPIFILIARLYIRRMFKAGISTPWIFNDKK